MDAIASLRASGSALLLYEGEKLVVREARGTLAVAEAERFDTLAALAARASTGALASAPIVVGGVSVGVLVAAPDAARELDERDRVILQLIAERYAILEDRKRSERDKDLFLKRAEHLQATAAELVRAENVQDIARVFAAPDRSATLGASACVLFEHVPGELALLGATPSMGSAAQEWRTIPLSAQHPLTEAARDRRAVFIADTEELRSRYPATVGRILQPDAVSRAAIPLVVGDVCIGVFGVSFHDRRAFDSDEVKYLTGVANLWGQALHRAHLAEAEREAMRRVLDAEASATRKKDEFMAMLGHELRNPLAPIVTATSLIRMRGRATPQELDILERQARHLVRLVDDLLDISRITSGKLSLNRARVQLADVMSQAVESTAQGFIDKRVRLYPNVVDESLYVEGDRDRLVQVVANLLVNAAKFTPSGKAVHITATKKDGEVVIEVRDEGDGIAPDLLPRVFDIFTQGRQSSDRRSGGLGLGLAIARSIVTAHGGFIQASSEGEGRGARFEVRLPALAAVPSAKAAAIAESAAPAPAPSENRSVLVVDDNLDSAEMIAEFLKTMGYEAAIAGDGPQALALLSTHVPDAAILDIGLPGMDGYELAEAITRAFGARAPKLIALTGYAQESDRERALHGGFALHVAKPIDVTKLAGMLDTILTPA